MAHPRMYDDDDPTLLRLRALCAALPGTTEKESWGRPTFRAGRIFAIYGTQDHPAALCFKPEEDERPALLADARFWAPPYHGPYGWLALDLDGDVDWAEVAELVASSFRLIAAPALVAQLDAAGRPGG